MDYARLSSGGWKEVPDDCHRLLDFCTTTLWGFVFSKYYRRDLKAIEHDLWRWSSGLSELDDVYLMTEAWFVAEGQFDWRVKHKGLCGRPRTMAGYRRVWNLLTFGARGLDYDSMRYKSPGEICRAWQGMAAIYDLMSPDAEDDGEPSMRRYRAFSQRWLLPHLSEKLRDEGCDFMLEAFMDGVELEDILPREIAA